MNARGFTYLEVLLAVVVLAMGTIGASQAVLSLQQQDERVLPELLAQQLLDDAVAYVRTLPRQDTVSPVFGREGGEGTGTVDDVDDLEKDVEKGPTDLAGTVWSKDWSRVWAVRSVSPNAVATTAPAGSTPLVEVQIVIEYLGAELARTVLLLARTP